MAAFRTGDTLVWIIGPVQDDSGNPVTGATWSAVVARRPDGTTFIPSYTEIPNTGDYLATVVSTMRGLWFLHSTTTVNGAVYTDSDKFTVDDELAYTASGSAGTVGAALANLDAAVTSRLSAASAAAPLANLDAAVSSRLPTTSYVIPSGNVVLTTSPIAVNGTLTLVQATDYATSEGRQLDWTTSDAGTWPDLTNATVLFVAKPQGSVTRPSFSVAGTVITPSGASKHVRVEIPRATTAAVSADIYDYQVQATLSNAHVLVLVSGTLDLSEFLT